MTRRLSTSNENPSDTAETRAHAQALDLLERRALSVAELRMRLLDRGHDAAVIEAVSARLVDARLLDDRRLAVDLLVTRSRRLGHGRARLLSELERRGIEAVTAEEAWREVGEQGDLDDTKALQRRLQRALRRERQPLDERARARVYNALLRAGFEPEAIAGVLGREVDSTDD